MRRPLITMLILASLGGCAVAPQGPVEQPPPIDPPATCTSAPQCDAMWTEALIQVQQLSGMRIQLATDTYAQTYRANRSGRLTATIKRVPRPQGGTSFDAEFSCVRCGTLPYKAANLFSANLKAVGERYAK